MNKIKQVGRLISEIGVPQEVVLTTEAMLMYWQETAKVGRAEDGAGALDLAALAEAAHSKAIRRLKMLGKFGTDTSWHMLLALFSEETRGRRVSVTDICVASGGPSTTALRHLKTLEDENVIYREADAQDKRRVYVHFTERGRQLVEQVVLETCEG